MAVVRYVCSLGYITDLENGTNHNIFSSKYRGSSVRIETYASPIYPFPCLYWWFVSLYSCLPTLREQYRSHNCDNGGTTSGPAQYEAVLHRTIFCIFCVCVQKDIGRGQSGLNQIKLSLCCPVCGAVSWG